MDTRMVRKTNIDFYSSDEYWMKSNLKAVDSFPDVWFMPGFWSEYGMCTEPSAFGSRMIFYEKSLPYAEKILSGIVRRRFASSA